MKRLSIFSLVLLGILAVVIVCGAYCGVSNYQKAHACCENGSASMDHSSLKQANSPESKLKISNDELLAWVDLNQIIEACGTKNIHLKENSLSHLPSLLHEESQLLVHHFTGAKDFI